MSQDWDVVARKVLAVAGPPVFLGVVGGLSGLAFQMMADSLIHRKKWIVPLAGAFAGATIGVLTVTNIKLPI